MIAVRHQRGTANCFANLEAQKRHGFIPQKAKHGSGHHGAEIRDGLGVEETREGLIASNNGTAQDQNDDEDARQISARPRP